MQEISTKVSRSRFYVTVCISKKRKLLGYYQHFSKGFGMKVTMINTSPKKEKEAIEQLGAGAFLVRSYLEQIKVLVSGAVSAFECRFRHLLRLPRLPVPHRRGQGITKKKKIIISQIEMEIIQVSKEDVLGTVKRLRIMTPLMLMGLALSKGRQGREAQNIVRVYWQICAFMKLLLMS